MASDSPSSSARALASGPPALARCSDALLVRHCRRGEPEAWRALVGRFYRYVRAIAAEAYRLDEHATEDVVQEVFARTYEHLPRLRDDAAIRPFLAQLTRRLAVDRLRTAARDRPADAPLPEGTPQEVFERVDDALVVRSALASLPAHHRQVVEMFFLEDQSYERMERRLGVPPGTIASRIARALEGLRRALADAESPGR